MYKTICLLLVAIALESKLVYSDGEFYSSIVKLEELITSEEKLIDILQHYVKNQRKKLEEVTEYVEYLNKHNKEAEVNSRKYVENPINALLLIKRLSEDWKHVRSILMEDSSKEVFTFLNTSLKLPSDEDLSGAIISLIRLQHTYNLNISQMASGNLNGFGSFTEMSANDCFKMGIHLHNEEKDYPLALSWLQEAERRSALEYKSKVHKPILMEYIASCHLHTKNKSKALEILRKLIKTEPNKERLMEVLKIYEAIDHISEEQLQDSHYLFSIIMNEYQKLCRGEIELSKSIQAKLKCYLYKTSTNTYLTVAPFKIEEVYRSPKILIYHDVLSEQEIQVLQNLAVPKLSRIQEEFSPDNDKPSKYRIGQLAWLDNHDHPFITSLRNRINDMTGLSMSFAESLQVLNYGMGGQGDPHYDYFEVPEGREEEHNENRLATILLYMNDVEQGGSTVFPYLGVSIPVRKGTAAVWYNLHSNLEPDSRTIHAGCPVLIGQKWISTQWIRDTHQTFSKPCDLKPKKMTPVYRILSQLMNATK